MTGNKKRALGGKTTASSMSIVEKLKILRSLNCGFSESDLSTCLRQSGYRVDVAAERLVTGQYRPLKKTKKNNQIVHGGAATATTTTERVISYPNNANATPRQATVRQQRHSSSTPSSSGIAGSRHHAVASSTEDQLTPLAPKKPKLTSGALVSSSSSILVTPKATTPASKNENDGKGKIDTDDWLLCHRWVGDGVNLQRDGACDYQEEFHVRVEPSSSPTASSSSNAPKPIRFRSGSHRMDGSFPRHLSFLRPLLRNQLIRVKTTALMEERRLSIGAQVAFSLSVWIVDPIQFFAIFDDNSDGSSSSSQVSSYSKQFFAAVAARESANNNSRRGRTNTNAGGPKPGSSLKSCRDAAFSMLQWAQYGKPLSSLRQETCIDNNNHDDNNEKNGYEALESNSDNDEGDIDAETSAVHTSANHEDAAIPHWAREVLCSDDGDNNNGACVHGRVDEGKDYDGNEKEMDTPFGFREGIQLRPYQKQSLYWMTQREKKFGSGRNQLLQLLHELASESSKTTNTGSIEDNEVCVLESRKEISCDCGPVLVDTNLVDAPSAAKALTANNVDHTHFVANGEELDHPLWERRFLCNEQRTKALSFYVQPSFRNAAAEPPPPPLPCRGGILADSMGLGKTVQLLAIVQSDANFENNRENNSDAREGNANTTNNSTLVVAPLSLLHQWQEEIENKTSLSCRVHYGDRNKNTSAYGSNDTVDVVLTTYGTLQAELRTQRDAGTDKTMPAKKTIILPLLSRNWKRVILDECHIIKNHSTLVAKACCLLRAERRWAVSGTIIQNSLEDVFSLMRYLRHEPFCEHAFWSSAVTKAPDFSVALNRVKKILSPIMIRRTKETRDKTGELILTLPEIDSKSVVVQFSLEERQFYEALYRKSFDIFKGFVRSGTASTSWLKIFSLLHRLRQTCSHVALTVKSQLDDGDWTSNIAQSSSGNGSEASMKKVVEEKDKDSIDQSFLEDLLKKFKCMQNDKSKTTSSQEKNYDNDYTKDEYAISVANMLNQAVQSDSSELNEECPICLENISMNDSAITPCLHIFCKKCLTGFLKNNTQSSGAMTPSLIPSSTQDKSCPICSKYIDSRKILRMTHSSSGKIQTSFLHQRIHGKAKENPNISTEDGDARKTLQTAMKGTSSSKLAAILEELQFVWKKEPGSKVLIFSQFLGFLDIIEKSFESNGIPYRRLDGKLSLKRRMEVLRDFGSEAQQSAPSHNSSIGSVLLISMKAGGVGLNLVAARSVFIVDPWWNAAVEDQCIDRIHRIGQSAKTIYVRKFFVADSIEERILELQKRKKGVARAVLCDKDATGADELGARPSIDDFKILFRA